MSESTATPHLGSVTSIGARKVQKLSGFLEIEPDRCRPWTSHNRDEAWLNVAGCRDLIDSIQNNGQVEPVILRALPQGSDKDFEIVAGVRRWFACSKIPHQKLLARVIEADDRSCMIMMHAENAHGQDITDFERAYSFAQQMKSGAFKNQSDLAKAMGLSQSSICKMIASSELFEIPWLAQLFDNKREISLRHAYRLSTFLKKPALYLKLETEAARILEENKKTRLKVLASTILQRLIDCVQPTGSNSSKAVQEHVLFKKDEKAMVVATKDHSGNFSLNFHSDVKTFNPEQIIALCVQAVHEYFMVEKKG